MAVHSCLTRGGVAGMIIPSIKKKHENEHGWLGNPSWTKMYVLLKMGIPYCHVSFGGSVHVCLLDPTHPWWCRNFSDQQEAESEKSYLHLSDSGRKPSTANPEINGGFWFPLIGGRGYIIPQLAVYTTYIPLIYIYIAFWGVICHLPPVRGNQKQPLMKVLTFWNFPMEHYFWTWKFPHPTHQTPRTKPPIFLANARGPCLPDPLFLNYTPWN